MPPKNTHNQKAKIGSTGGTLKNPHKPASAQKTDIKGFFVQTQQQDQQEGPIVTELNFVSPSKDTEPDVNNSPGDNIHQSIMGLEGAEGGPSWDLQTYIKTLPTREDMDKYIHRLESSYRAEIQTLKSSLMDTQNKIGDLDTNMVVIDQKISNLKEKNQDYDRYLKHIINSTDELENRSRRNNIRVRGLPESVNTENLKKVLQDIFNSLLKQPNSVEIEIDRAHRIQSLKEPDSKRSRDVICRINFFQIKGSIMAATRLHRDFEYQGTHLIFFQDLSRYTLIRRKAVKPLLDVLREKEILYRWGFPFQIIVHQKGQKIIFCSIEDLPDFLKRLQLPLIDLPACPQPYQGLVGGTYNRRY